MKCSKERAVKAAKRLHFQAPHGDPGLSAQIAGEQCQVPLLADHVLHCGGLQRFHHLDLIGKTVPLHIGERDGIPGVQSPYGAKVGAVIVAGYGEIPRVGRAAVPAGGQLQVLVALFAHHRQGQP